MKFDMKKLLALVLIVLSSVSILYTTYWLPPLVPKVYATGTPIPVNQIIQDVIMANSNTAWIVMPDYTYSSGSQSHTSATKCGGAGAGTITDIYATDTLMGSLAANQNQVLDTNSAYISQSTCGQPTTSTSQAVVAIAAGPNEVTRYYGLFSSTGQSNLWYNTGTSCFVRRDTQVNVLCNGVVSATQDYLILDSFTDSAGRNVYEIYGLGWIGTVAATDFLTQVVLKNPTTYTSAWYIFRWNDASSGVSANSIPDGGDTWYQIGAGPSSATLGQSLTNAINLGVAYMNRHYDQVASGVYAMRDSEGVPIYIRDTNTGEVRMAGDQAPGTQYDYAAISSNTNNGQDYYLQFETGTDTCGSNYCHNDIVFRVIYTAISFTTVQVKITQTQYSPDNGHQWNTYFKGGVLIGSGNWVGQPAVTEKAQYGWPTFRYVHRHETNLAQEIYAGFDTTKAINLQNFMTNYGFSTDAYDPMMIRDGLGADALPVNFLESLDRTWWDEYIWYSSQWNSLPHALGGPYASYPYKSRVLGLPAMNTWQTYAFPDTPIARMSEALERMEIGSFSNFDVNTVRSLLNAVNWDGYGVEGNCNSGACYFDNNTIGTTSRDSTCYYDLPYCTSSYGTFNTAYFLVAATLFAYYASDSTYGTYADQAAQMLLNLLLMSPYVKTADFGSLVRPDAIDGFLAGYRTGSGPIFKGQTEHGILDTYWNFEDELCTHLGWNCYVRMKSESGIIGLVSVESTALAVWALQVYKAWRFNNNPSSFPWSHSNLFDSDYVDCSGAGPGSLCEAHNGAADIRLGVNTNGGTATGYASVKWTNNVGVTIPSGTLLNLRFFDRGFIAGCSTSTGLCYAGSLSMQFKVWRSGSLIASSSWNTIHSYTGDSPLYEDSHTITWSLPVQVQNGDVIELLFSASIQGPQDSSVYADWASAPYYGLSNLGFIRIGYLQASSYWTVYGG